MTPESFERNGVLYEFHRWEEGVAVFKPVSKRRRDSSTAAQGNKLPVNRGSGWAIDITHRGTTPPGWMKKP